MSMLLPIESVRSPNIFALMRRQAPLFAAVLVLIGFILAGMAALDVYLYPFQVAQGARSARNLSAVLADDTDRSLRAVLSIVAGVVDRLQSQTVHGVDALSALAAFPPTSREPATGPRVDSLFIAAADGQLYTPSAGEPRSITELRGGDYFTRLRHAPPRALYVSTPFLSSIDGAWQLTLAERVSDSEGGFLGIAGAVVELAPFEALLRRLSLGAHESVSIFRDDGAIIACYPQREIAFGGTLEDTAFHEQLISRSFEGVTRNVSAADGVERMFAISRSENFPVVSVAGIAMNDVLADWRRQAEVLAAGVGIVVLAIMFGAIRLARHIEQLADARQREAVQAQVAIQYRRFTNAVDNIVQGLAMFDRSSRLIACNRRYAEIYGLPLSLTKPGVSRDEIVAHRGHGEISPVTKDPGQQPDGSVMSVHRLKDGRVIAQRKMQLPEGGWVSTHEDVTERRRVQAKLEELASRDALTGLFNRFAFQQRLEQHLVDIRRPSSRIAVLYIDLDRFQLVNDRRGHVAGDVLLREASARILAAVRTGDTVARLGGDEFAIIHRLGRFPGDGAKLAERLIAAISEPYVIDGEEVEVGASIGVSLAPDHGVDANELTRMADMALHNAKLTRGCHVIFDPSMDEAVRYQHDMRHDLRVALAQNQFELYFQPVVGAADRKVRSFEALLRWTHPTRGAVPPSKFIPIAEEIGLIVPLGEWVVREACKEAARWPAHINVAVNVSAAQFKSHDLLWSVSDALDTAGLAAGRLIIEVTESIMINDAEHAMSTLHALRAKGIAIAMDDFGTGYSSLSYLRRFPFDKIKIDKTFIDEMGVGENGVALVRAATALAKAFGMEAVAEGIETEEQFARATAEGCVEVQGYLISRPMPARDVFAYLGAAPREPPPRAEAVAATRTVEDWRNGLLMFPSGAVPT